ncbi:CPBP family intramembrane metalloprotease [Psychromarinibacter sp. C21-152]|uniref:CPBP family intramembrane metalloprotease n=1 Tax=Psychromarinibacter sediminicola TaxID=3033385 RepID=A0AAE3NS61_9RHOB|nr:CPBP family intramembrane glutamic endopeptidase [Psychromarinibacter sediminicola]MDF0600644.1 CPBP family intramembrane metalloprotease [Psychromarinibacter sediminicola]
MTPRYPDPLESFVHPARAAPEPWRLALGCLLCTVIYVIGLNLYLVLVTGLPGAPSILAVTRAQTPGAALWLLGSFAAMALGPWVAAPLLHARPPVTLFGHTGREVRDFATAAAAVGGVQVLSVLVWSLFNDAVPGVGFGLWLTFLPLSVAVLALQAGAEEILFRGYLLQQLAARFRSPLVWAVLPSLLFGLLHYDPAMGDSAWQIVLATLIFGLIAADLTAATGSLAAAWGMHFANNATALLLLATEGTVPGLALYRTPYVASEAGGLIVWDVVVLLIGWGLARRALLR